MDSRMETIRKTVCMKLRGWFGKKEKIEIFETVIISQTRARGQIGKEIPH